LQRGCWVFYLIILPFFEPSHLSLTILLLLLLDHEFVLKTANVCQ